MRQSSSRILLGALAVALLLAASGCSAEAKRNRHLKSADRYFAAGDLEKAEIEYLNALQFDRKNPRAVGQLGIIYFDEGRIGRTIPFLKLAEQLDPDNLDVRLKLGQLYLSGGKAKEAGVEASYILSKRPLDEQAPVLLAGTVANPRDAAAVRDLLLRLPAPAPDGPPVLVALGYLDLRQGKLSEATSAFERAESADPKSALPHTAMAVLYRVKKEAAKSEQELKTASELSSPRSPTRLQYAQLKIQSGDAVGGRRLLEEITQKTPDYLPAWFTLAELAASDKNYDASDKLLSKVLERDPTQPEALILSARIKLAKGQAAAAVAELERDLKLYPESVQFNYQLGMAYIAAGDRDKAFGSLNRAVTLDPNSGDAAVALAELDIRTGDMKAAVGLLEKLVKQRPDVSQAWLLLADALRGENNLAGALAVYRHLQKAYPTNPQPFLLSGLVLVQQENIDEARQDFSKALEIVPSYLPAMEQLVNADLAQKHYEEAKARVQGEIAQFPKLAGPHLLMAKIYLAQADATQAETAFKKAIELEPDSPSAYFLLARLYAGTKQNEKALTNLHEAISKNPKDSPAMLLVAMIQDEEKNYAVARDYYEKVIAINPTSSIATNNLAYLYSERFNELDKAYEMAQRARQLRPLDPRVADTLGWILFKRHEYPWALSLLQESTANLATDADTQFHLGMAHYMMGEEDAARLAIQRSLELDPDFIDAAEARKRLAILSVDPKSAGEAGKSKLQEALEEHKDDPVALGRLAAIYESEGSLDKAAEAWEAVVKANPANVRAMTALARIYAAHHDNSKAIAMAKAAHKLAPNDPRISRELGRLAFDSGEYAWSVSLLDEANRSEPDRPDVLCDLAEAYYSVGRVPEAIAAMQQALSHSSGQAGSFFARADEARRFLEMTAIPLDPAREAAAGPRVEQILGSDPAYVPALVAKAAISESKADDAGAKETYKKVLGYYPDFVPAERQLAILFAQAPGDDKEAYVLATKALEAYPNDPELAKAAGIILYRLGNFEQAATSLKAAAGSRANDSNLMFYLGMADYRLKARGDARIALQRGLDLGLDAGMAAQARQALAELK
jgi:tetratricopeptide (TPR) repeat protein